MADTLTLESVVKRDRLFVVSAIVVAVVAAWIYLIALLNRTSDMASMSGMAMAVTELKPWTPLDFVLMFVMWVVMMVGMMVPSATPAILEFAALNRQKAEHGEPFVPTAVFVAGYITVWVGFSVVATLAQWGLRSLALLSPQMVITSPLLGGLLLIATGIYQWSPVHHNILQRCRNPLPIFLKRWNEQTAAFVVGLENGGNCLGCCWVMMSLLFVGGVMNLLWVAALTIFILLEKVLPYGELCARWSAVPLALAGVFVIFHGRVS